MPKAILEFNLPEEKWHYQRAIKGSDYASAIEAVRKFIRDKLKYEVLPFEQCTLLDKITDIINEELTEE